MKINTQHIERITPEWLNALPKAKVRLGACRSWRNENPGEGGTIQEAHLAEDYGPWKAGERVSLTGNGHHLVGVEGGWQSRKHSGVSGAPNSIVELPLFSSHDHQPIELGAHKLWWWHCPSTANLRKS